MLDAKGDALYVGKARSLKKRVAAYTQLGRLDERLRRMVNETAAMEVITTHTEAEALLLEANLIKRLKPRFNIVLRDDKSYPWLMLTEDHPYPADRQAPRRAGAQGQLLGAVRLGLGGEPDGHRDAAGVPAALLRRHGVRQPHAAPACCTRSAAARRLASAGSSEADYGRLVGQAKAFLAGKLATVQRELAAEMEQAAGSAGIRARRGGARPDPRADLRAGQRRGEPGQPAGRRRDRRLADRRPDLRAGVLRPRRAQQRQPRVLPDAREGRGGREVLAAFIAQFYDDKPPPPCVLVNHALPEQDLVAEALSLKADRKVEILTCRSAARSARWCSTPRSMRARRWSASWRRAPARRSCWTAWRSCSGCRRRRSASRCTTTRTSWAPTRTA